MDSRPLWHLRQHRCGALLTRGLGFCVLPSPNASHAQHHELEYSDVRRNDDLCMCLLFGRWKE